MRPWSNLSSTCAAVGVILLSFATLIMATAACNESSPCGVTLRRRAQGIWEAHEAAVVRALNGRQDNDEFVNAVDFFADVAGIEIHVNIFPMGYLPEPEAREDLVRIQEWYSKNKQYLCYDPASEAVEVRKP